MLKTIAKFIGLAVILLPVTFITTFLLAPLWRWLEASYGIESIGHSGPADWCFVFVYLVLLTIALCIWLFLRKREPAKR